MTRLQDFYEKTIQEISENADFETLSMRAEADIILVVGLQNGDIGALEWLSWSDHSNGTIRAFDNEDSTTNPQVWG